MSATLPTDVSVRARLADIAGDDPEFIAELINAFILGGEEALQELRTGVQHDDLGALGRAAHKLKGASANLHIETLAALVLDLETRAKAGERRDWRDDVAKISMEFARAAASLRQEIPQDAGARRKAG